MAHQVVLADDRPLIREGLKLALSVRPGFLVSGEARDGQELLELLRHGNPPDVVILDLAMPRLSGIPIIREIRKIGLCSRVLVLTMHKDEDLLCQAFLAGADGYLLKEEMARELFPALEKILRGEVYVSPILAREVKDSWLKVFIASREDPSTEGLSGEEAQVLSLLAGGESNAQIAVRLQISRLSVSRHRAKVMKKLRIKRTADLVKYAVRRGSASWNLE